MGYSDKQLVRMTLPLFDFGGGAAETYSFRLPVSDSGVAMQGQLVGIGVMVTEVFATDTTTGSVAVGTAADADAYGILNVPDASADNDCIDATDDTDAIISESIAASTLIRVTLTNGTDAGAVTGQGIPYVDFYVW